MSRPAYHDFVPRILDGIQLERQDVLRVGAADLDPAVREIARMKGAASYVGVDLELPLAADKGGRVEDLLTNFGPESFDLLICSEVLQHVEDWRRVISVFKRIIRPLGGVLITTRSPALPKRHIRVPSGDPPFIESAPACQSSGKPTIFREHKLAHALLDGLSGLEIGAAAHNPFGLRTRNVALAEGYEFYAASQREAMGVQPAPVDIWAPADNIPVPDASEDFVISSHVVEHLPNVIAAFVEWDRIVRDGGYVFMIVPLKGALEADEPRELTPLAHFVEDCYLGRTLDTHPITDVPGGRGGHYHTFTPDFLLDVVAWMRRNQFCEWELVAREDIDRKVGNGFALAFRVRHSRTRAVITKPNWRYEMSDMEAIFSDFEIVTLETDPSEPGVLLFARKPVGFQERDLEDYPLFSVTANQRISAMQRRPPGQTNGEWTSASHPYNKHYYENYESACGVPYRRTEPWLNFFSDMAAKIVREINPRRVLDVGCAMGFLVEALRDRQVEAFGLDISEYAISQCREDIRPYCWVASALDPFPLHYDLIVCIEVLEHLPRRDAGSAVANLCRHADDILFSSTPDDFTELTHVNVQPLEYWAGLFAKHGFYRDVEFDASFVAPHAVRFRKVTEPISSVIRDYERALWTRLREAQALRQRSLEVTGEKHRLESQLSEAVQAQQRLGPELSAATQEIQRLEKEIQHRDGKIERLRISMEANDARTGKLDADLREIQKSLGWRLLSAYSRARNRWLPSGSGRRAYYDLIIKRVKVGLGEGHGAPSNNVAVNLGRVQPAIPSKSVSSAGASASGKAARLWGTRVLMISGSDGDMERYRCYHGREQLRLFGLHCDVRHLKDMTFPRFILDYDLVILHRVPHSEFIDGIVRTAHAHRMFVLFDIDDLVFDPEVAKSIHAFRSMDPDQQALYMDGVRRYQRTLHVCDGSLVTTDDLAESVAKAGKPAWVHRNALSLELLEISEEAFRSRQRSENRVIIGYASGTRTHNRDFQEVEKALQRILEVYPQVELWIIGYLDLNEHWAKWASRVTRIPFVPWRALPGTLARLDINLAPLEADNPFCRAKSELKYLEAAAVGVPTIASKVGAFEFAIRHGENGLLAQGTEDWFQALERLITDDTLRLAMGERARLDALERYHPSTRGAELLDTLDKAVETLRRMSSSFNSPSIEHKPVSGGVEKPRILKEHGLAHALLDGLSGLEIGAGAQNPFGLRTRNVALAEGHEFYADYQREVMGVEPAPVDIWAPADNIPVPDASEDFVISSHVVEHLPNVIAAFVEWDRIVRDGGYVFMIVPLKGALAEDEPRELTPLAHFVDDYRHGMTLDTHLTVGVPGGRMGYYHTFTPDSLLEVVKWMRENRLCDWELVAREDIDSKVGNGFTLAFQVRHW